jgi:hypothetical protein
LPPDALFVLAIDVNVQSAAQEAGELFDIALLECRGERDGERVVASQDAECGHRTPRKPRCDLRQKTGVSVDFTAAALSMLCGERASVRPVAEFWPDSAVSRPGIAAI